MNYGCVEQEALAAMAGCVAAVDGAVLTGVLSRLAARSTRAPYRPEMSHSRAPQYDTAEASRESCPIG